jgi:hypothetical protein
MVPRSSPNDSATRPGDSFLLVRCRRGERLPIAFALRSLMQPNRLELIGGAFDIVARLSNNRPSNLDWLNDLPGIESYVQLEATS